MDSVRYAERSAGLLNADLDDAECLTRFLHERQWLREKVADRDATVLRRFVRELRPVFEASNEGDEPTVVRLLNELLGKHPVTPCISGHDAAGGSDHWHLHVADQSASVSELLIAESLMGLSMLVCDLGANRLGVCDAHPCDHVFVDTSPNRSRRYCSDRCSSRANVAAYRARQRAASA